MKKIKFKSEVKTEWYQILTEQNIKLRKKLKSMEIAFEMINNDRTRLIGQVAELELALEKSQESK